MVKIKRLLVAMGSNLKPVQSQQKEAVNVN